MKRNTYFWIMIGIYFVLYIGYGLIAKHLLWWIFSVISLIWFGLLFIGLKYGVGYDCKKCGKSILLFRPLCPECGENLQLGDSPSK